MRCQRIARVAVRSEWMGSNRSCLRRTDVQRIQKRDIILRARAERFRVPGELVIHVPLETPYLVWRGYRVDRIVLFINHVRPYAVKEGWRLAVRAAKPNHIVALFSGSGGQRQLKSIGQN